MIAQFRCPACGTALHVSSVAEANAAPAGFQTRTMQSFNLGSAAPNLEQVHERITPTRGATIEGDVRVPLAQAAITAVAVTVPIALLTASGHGSAWIPISAFGVTLTASWLWLLADHRSLLRTIERITQRDLDHDGRIAEQPIIKRVSFNAVEQTAAGRYLRSRRIDIPRGDEKAIVEMARGISADEPFTQRRWAHLYNRDEFNTLRDTLIQHGYIVWRDNNNHNSGVDLLAPGRSLFRALAEQPTPPPDLLGTA